MDPAAPPYKVKIITFYLLTILILVVWVAVSAYISWLIFNNIEDYHDIGRGLFLAVIPTFIAVYGLAVFLVYSPTKPKGLRVKNEDVPRLFELITATATHLGLRNRIDEVLLTPGMSVKVYYRPSMSNFLVESTCKLYIGVGLLRFLSTSELQAVIGHELAHFSQPQTRYKAYLARIINLAKLYGENGALKAVSHLGGMDITMLPSRFMCWLINTVFDNLVDVNSKEYKQLTLEMELDADRIAAQAFGANNLRSALCKSISVNMRLGIYKQLILPYLSCYRYRCESFWTTFEDSAHFFEDIDGLVIAPDSPLRHHNKLRFDESEVHIPLRLVALESMDITLTSTTDCAAKLLPGSIISGLDMSLCKKYRQLEGEAVSRPRLRYFLATLREAVFNDISSIDDAYRQLTTLINEVIESQSANKQIIMPEYATPPGNVYSGVLSTMQPTETIYTAAAGTCPVCGHEIAPDTKICPHCKEQIAE